MRLAFRPRGKIASLGVLMLVALASAITLVFLLKQLEDQAWVEHTLDVRSQLLRTLATLQDAETGERGFLLTNDESFLEPYEAAIRAIDEQFDKLGKAVSDRSPTGREAFGIARYRTSAHRGAARKYRAPSADDELDA